ncbi:MAG: hypothetical protein JWR80_2897 [Bradyrhizobium sp.]|nr:hypothetical protein [Bradyrhizobium sp.]
MKVMINLTLAEYIRQGNSNTEGLLAGHHPLMELVTAYHDFFATKLWSEAQPIPQVPMFLSTNAFMLWIGGVRMAMTGHEAAVYPLFRTALESACYVLLICLKPELTAIWADRDKGEAQRRASRNAFGSAVADIVTHMGSGDTDLGGFISQLYAASIDFGAHPNARGIMAHVQTGLPDGGAERFDQGSIYPGNSLPVFRALTAAIEYGRGIALVLVHSLPTMSKEVVGALHDLQHREAALFSKDK